MSTLPCVYKDVAWLKYSMYPHGKLFTSDSDVVTTYTRTYIDTIPINYSNHATSDPLCPSVVSPCLANGQSNT